MREYCLFTYFSYFDFIFLLMVLVLPVATWICSPCDRHQLQATNTMVLQRNRLADQRSGPLHKINRDREILRRLITPAKLPLRSLSNSNSDPVAISRQNMVTRIFEDCRIRRRMKRIRTRQLIMETPRSSNRITQFLYSNLFDDSL